MSVVMPDPLALTRSYLLSVPAVVDAFGDRIHGRVPAEKVWPLIRLQVVPGGVRTVRERIERAMVDVNVYSGTTPEEASRLARLVHAELLDASGWLYEPTDPSEVAGVILDVREILGPYDQPDVAPDRDEPLARYLSTVSVHYRPNP